MSIAMTMLIWSVVLGLAQIVLVAALTVGQRGLSWAVGARDEDQGPLRGLAGRFQRALGNFVETFALFAALVLAASILGRANAELALGAQLYFWARLVYVPAYAAGIPWLRTLVWAVSIVGIVLVLIALF